ncbi:hypothetical protein ADK57_27265 [Streptomyces sp. MMG1533]|uniref:DUF262 domain-containing protein n=1 Tax=Streptomyces sp. MMG1533 TaxID=1415546 RepID=UPI0006AEBF49|nr:DUF262 domain-containing protein [Streptomyces sp. MMG1533]KOU61616.1 hypothetical protein ADK57_27265 [Streptomyces sp. MMG1533]
MAELEDGENDARGSLFESPVEIGANGRPTGVELELPADEPERGSEPFDPDSVSIDILQVTVEELLDRLTRGALDLAPDFQRRASMWSEVQQSRLIESSLLGIPLPPFFLAQQENDDWSVVDGTQRLTALVRFMAPGLINATPLALRGLDFLEQFEGKGYQELPGRLRIRLRETRLVVHLVRLGTPEAVKFNVFSRINAAGLPLTRQEIRHAMIPGPARDFLADLTEEPAFGEATGWGVSNERMTDREMVLRYLAFRLSPPEEYRQQDFEQFLNEAMHRVNALSDEQREWEARQFREAMKCAHDVFGRHAFRKSVGRRRKSPVNKALFEAVAVNLADLEDHQRELLVTSRDKVQADLAFQLDVDWNFARALSVDTSNAENVRTRFRVVKQVVQGVLSGD